MPHHELLACLLHEQEAVNAFIELLQQESQALVARAAPAALGEITERKQLAAERLAALGNERDAVLHSLGFAAGHAGTEAAAARYLDVAPVWQALLEASATAKQLNERNGVLIATHLRFNQDALAALRSASGANLYGANGRQPAIGSLSAPRRA